MANFFYVKKSNEENEKTVYGVSAIEAMAEIDNNSLKYTKIYMSSSDIRLYVTETLDEVIRLLGENSNVVELTAWIETSNENNWEFSVS